MKKKLIIILAIIIAIVAFVIVYRYYNKEDKTTTLTISEKNWVQSNKDQSYDFEIVNDYPLYGTNGEGVLFNFLSDFQENIGIEFNQISYLKDSNTTGNEYRIRILDNDDKLGKNDILIFTDTYVAIGKDYQRINYIKDFNNTTFGIFSKDQDYVSYYLKSASNVSLKPYETSEELFNALDNNEVNMIIVPNIMYLDYTIKNDKYSINYYFNELNKQVVLTLSDSNKELNTIVRKYYNKWKQTNFVQEYNEAYFEYYVSTNELSAKQKASLVSKNYTYGYVENPPYETKVNNKIAGIAGEYVSRMTRLADINFKYVKYNTKEDLKKAIDKGEIDIYFDYYDFNNKKYDETLSTFIEEYVVLGKQKDNHIVTSLESLRNKDIAVLKGDSLNNFLKTNSQANIKTYDNIKDLVKKSDDKIIVVDNEIYNYYQNKYFKKYTLLYKDTMMSDYKFKVKNNNKEFYDLFNYIINTNSYYNYRNSGIENMNASIIEDSTLEQVYTIVLCIIFIPLIVFGIVLFIIRKRKQKKKLKIKDRHKYTDMLTSLKNRNYLNAKVGEWEDCEIFPQAVIIVDLNNVKYVNDNYGHEEGEQLIIKAAGILVNTQLENSEIIRTDGNEFLIYLIGYSERQISTYTKKLAKEMKSLPHEFGAAIGFSMISDEIKTIDDAINEATLEMITNKEEYK